MTNEIKEILKDFKSMSEGTISPYELTDKDCKLLLDYITNLQEEKQRLLESADCLSKGYNDLEQRIDRASNLCEPFVEWGECTINGKILKQILDILRGDE